MISLNYPAIYVNDNISHTEIFLHLFSSHSYVRFGHEYQPGSIRVFKELSPKQFSFEVAPLLSHIGDFLIQCNLLTLLEIPDVLELLKKNIAILFHTSIIVLS